VFWKAFQNRSAPMNAFIIALPLQIGMPGPSNGRARPLRPRFHPAWLVRALQRTAVGCYTGAQTVVPATPYTDERSRLSLGRGHVPRGLLFTSGRPNAIPPWGEGGGR
jgi:hypothetical protein